MPRKRTKDHIGKVVLDLTSEMRIASAAVVLSLRQFADLQRRVDQGEEVLTDEADAVEAIVDTADRCLSGVAVLHGEIKGYIRRQLIEAGADGWKTDGRVIYKEEVESVF